MLPAIDVVSSMNKISKLHYLQNKINSHIVGWQLNQISEEKKLPECMYRGKGSYQSYCRVTWNPKLTDRTQHWRANRGIFDSMNSSHGIRIARKASSSEIYLIRKTNNRSLQQSSFVLNFRLLGAVNSSFSFYL